MSVLGISDPSVLLAYLGCFLSVAFCVLYSLRAGDDSDSEDESDD